MKQAILYTIKIWLISTFIASAAFAYILFFDAGDYFQYHVINSIAVILFILRIVLFICAWALTTFSIVKNAANTVVKKISIGVSGIGFSMSFLFLPNVGWLLNPHVFFAVWHVVYVFAFLLSVAVFRLPKSLIATETT